MFLGELLSERTGNNNSCLLWRVFFYFEIFLNFLFGFGESFRCFFFFLIYWSFSGSLSFGLFYLSFYFGAFSTFFSGSNISLKSMVYNSSNPMLCSLFIISIYCSISLSCSFINFIWLLISSIKLSCIRSRFLFSSKFSSAI